MKRSFVRAWMLALLAGAALGSAGCIHTWTDTVGDYPRSAFQRPPGPIQGDPPDN